MKTLSFMKLVNEVFIFLLVFTSTALAMDRDVAKVVQCLESKYKINHTTVPFTGAINFFTSLFSRGKVATLGVTVFDDLHNNSAIHSTFEDEVQLVLGQEWNPMVKSTFRHTGEKMVVFVNTSLHRNRLKAIVVNISPEMVVVTGIWLDLKTFSKITQGGKD